MNFAGSQLAVFKGANEGPYLNDVGEASSLCTLGKKQSGTLRLQEYYDEIWNSNISGPHDFNRFVFRRPIESSPATNRIFSRLKRLDLICRQMMPVGFRSVGLRTVNRSFARIFKKSAGSVWNANCSLRGRSARFFLIQTL